MTQFQGLILRAAANNRVCGHASGCGYAPTSPTSKITDQSERVESSRGG